MPTLYELQDQYKRLYELLTDGDIDEQTLHDTLDAIDFSGEFETKADGYARIIRQFNADAEAAKAEAARLSERSKTFSERGKQLTARLFDAMKSTGNVKFKTQLFSFGIRNNPPALQVFDESLIPDSYTHIEHHRVIDKALIKDLLKSGGIVAGCRLTQGESLQIR